MLPWLASQPPVGVSFGVNRASPQAVGLQAWWTAIGSRDPFGLTDYQRGLKGSPAANYAVVNDAIFGRVMSFDGSSSAYVDFPGLHFGPTIAISVWVRINNVGSSAAICGEFDNPGNTWLFYYRGGAGSFELYDGSGTYFDVPGGAVANTWYHVVFVNIPSVSCQGYLNGMAQTMSGGARTWSSTSNDFNIGKWGVAPMQGAIADLRIGSFPTPGAVVLQQWAAQTRWQLAQPLPMAVYDPTSGQPMMARARLVPGMRPRARAGW